MKKLTKIIKAALKGIGENEHLCIDLHRCSRDWVETMTKLLPKEMVMREGASGSTQWVEYSLEDCDGFHRVELTMFFEY